MPYWLRVLLVGIGGTFALIVCAIAIFSWYIHVAPFRKLSFDPAIWSASLTRETETTCYRGGMAHDIREQHLNQRMSRADVLSLLGQPDALNTDTQYQYVLGMCSGFLMDYDVLDVYFDSAGHYLQAKIVQH